MSNARSRYLRVIAVLLEQTEARINFQEDGRRIFKYGGKTEHSMMHAESLRSKGQKQRSQDIASITLNSKKFHRDEDRAQKKKIEGCDLDRLYSIFLTIYKLLSRLSNLVQI